MKAIMFAIALTGCASAQPHLAKVNEAAALLCEASPARLKEAEAHGVSVGDLCKMREVIAPYEQKCAKVAEEP